jgi:ribosomal protein L32
MLLRDKTGIKCDLCGINYHTEFTYYSFDFRDVNIYGPSRPSLDMILKSPIGYSCDVCLSCFEGLKEKIIANNVNRKSLRCDISGESLVSAKKYYYCVVSSAKVSMAKKLSECKKCKQKTYDEKICSKCGHNGFVKMADITVDGRHVELTISQTAYDGLKSKALTVSHSDWSSKSEG